LDDRPRYDEKLARILRISAAVIAEKGYHQASIRDIASATGVSLSGLYYYFSSKEELLFLIQHHCFETILARLDHDLQGESDPRVRLEILVRNHLRFFVANMAEMKVLSHEADSLSGDYLRDVRSLKQDYLLRLEAILEALAPPDTSDVRVSALMLFGMLNWIYTWYRPARYPGVDLLADRAIHLFLEGYLSPEPRSEMVPGQEAEAPSIWRDL
jgi:AcrR family transcriptional regulator